MKSVKAIDPGAGPRDEPPPSGGRNAEADFHGEKRTNAKHASTTDPEARLYRKRAGHGGAAHALVENRCGLVVDACLTQANGHAALAMIEKHADRPRASHLGPTRAMTRPTS